MASFNTSSLFTPPLRLIATIGVLLLVAAIVPLEAAFTCPKGQVLMGNRCVKTYRPAETCSKDFSFYSANAFCQANGGQLVSIHSQAQQDFITALIKKDQHSQVKKCGCHSSAHDYNYWIGLKLSHSASGAVNGSSWTDATTVNYGNPMSASFRPPFVDERPRGSADDGGDDSAVCPDGETNNCVQIYGYGSATGMWIDRNCNNTHTIAHSCSCTTDNTTNANSFPSSSSEEAQVNECRDELALNGFICEYCPQGWTMFNNHCYKAVAVSGTSASLQAACVALGAVATSIHSTAENQFVAGLATAANPASQSYYIGVSMTHATLAPYSPVTSFAWVDGSSPDYGNAMVAPWNVAGVYPWAPFAPPPGYPAQPDNRPAPGNCVIMWLPANPNMGNYPSTWDDILCSGTTDGTVCKID